jgi:hypothetical protein
MASPDVTPKAPSNRQQAMAVDNNFTLLYGLAQTSHMISDWDALFEIYMAHKKTIVPLIEAGSWDDIRSLSASPLWLALCEL